jgi:hypothetical protein
MAEINSILDTLLSGSSLSALSELTGAGGDQVQKVLAQAVPTLVTGMKKNASSQDGEQSLATALSQHAKDDTSDVASFLKNADLTDGDKIISHILGGQKPAVESGIAQRAGVSKNQTATILSAAAPLLLSLLGNKKDEEDKKEEGGGLMGMLGSLLGGGGGSGNDGFGLDDVASMLLGSGKDNKDEKEEKEESGGGLGDMLMGGLGSLLGLGGSDEKEKKPAAKKPTTKKKTTAKKTGSNQKTSKKPTAVKKPTTSAAKRPTIRRKIP